ncbi:hypothetical protein [Flavobacterium sp. NKUCC04_CG]|uniref:hypothetical protein n=1 Tax=Flavobacterium sp. NKUCC04_CG TaxID=2842121 RepID=UPI001C5B2467|nr:hypothetical protein [Flavobacterium sp. NKUCC04_CG]MBW3517691.1 hypothetical protein [Flavobacterium sp. NKUCC04_CG]
MEKISKTLIGYFMFFCLTSAYGVYAQPDPRDVHPYAPTPPPGEDDLPVPIGDYLPCLLLAGVGIAFYATASKKQKI